MANTFLISDTHFGHAKILNFTGDNDQLIRPEFKSVEEMDETMVSNWNSVVRPQDKVYHLGDVVMRKEHFPIISRLNGKKSLVMGNHDIFDAKEYLKWFKNVRGIKVFDGYIFSHIPIRRAPTSAELESKNRFTACIHGHIHEKDIDDPWYFNVSVERINYTPISWDNVKKLVAQKAHEGH